MYKYFSKLLPFKLRQSQLEVIENIEENKNFLLTACTSWGKTIIAYYYLYLAIMQNKKIIFTVPLKSLSSEKSNELNSKDFFLNKIKTINCLMDTGDTTETRLEAGINYYDTDWDVLLTTNERLDVILRSPVTRETVMQNVEYVIFDEIHLLGNKSRGSTIEFLIMVFKHLYPNIKMVGLSATLPNAKEFAKWMKAESSIIPEEKRPVPIEDIILPPHYSEFNSADRFEFKFKQAIKELEKHPKEQFLIFVNSRDDASKMAKKLTLLKLKENGISNIRGKLSIDEIIQNGIAYHHAGLSLQDRARIEQGFKEGAIQIIISTPTLAMGVNLPCTNVMIFSLSRWNPYSSSMEVIEDYLIAQMRGRAGRPQYDTFGRCLLLGNIQELQYGSDVINNPSGMVSQIETMLDEKILSLISSNIVDNTYDIIEIFKSSFGYNQYLIKEDLIAKEIDYLVDKEFLIQDEEGDLYVSKMGAMCNVMYVKPRTVVETINNLKNLTSYYDEEELMSCFIKNGETLDPIRIQRMDRGLIGKVRKVFETAQGRIDVLVYNYTSKEWILRNKINEYSKLLGFIYNNQLKVKTYISNTELWMLRENTVRLTQRLWSIIRTKKHFKDSISQDDMRKIFAMIKYGEADEDKAYLGALNGIGRKTWDKLNENGIDKLSIFLKTPNHIIQAKTKLTEEKIKRLKAQAKDSFPDYAKYLHKPKLVTDFFK